MEDKLMEEIHEQAMEILEKALFVERKNKSSKEDVFKLKESAFKLEKEVADFYIIKGVEPTRIVTCMSCAYLAKDIGYMDNAKEYTEKVIQFNSFEEYIEEAKELIKLL